MIVRIYGAFNVNLTNNILKIFLEHAEKDFLILYISNEEFGLQYKKEISETEEDKFTEELYSWLSGWNFLIKEYVIKGEC